MLGGLLLRLLLRRSLAAPDEAADLHLDDERLVVIGSDFVDDVILRKLKTSSLRELLQRGLVVLEEQVLLVDRLDVGEERLLDQAPHGLDAAVEIDPREQR